MGKIYFLKKKRFKDVTDVRRTTRQKVKQGKRKGEYDDEERYDEMGG